MSKKDVQTKAETAADASTCAQSEWYFSASDGRPPVTIISATFEEAVEQYNERFNLKES
ncbi:MAG: hypothetical protein WCV84_04645 [Patescibacteria group bacterium]